MSYLLLGLFALLPIVGTVQVIGSIIRGFRMNDWRSPYGIGLRNYYFAVIVFALLMLLLFDERHSDEIILPMISLSIPIAMYYWYVVNKSDPK